MASEESETPGGERGRGSSEGLGQGGLGRRAEGDLLAERRARRAAESGKDALVHRAEVAEATLQTLQAHVMSLQERLREAEEDRARLADAAAQRRSSHAQETSDSLAEAATEHELRRAKQREYAEQQLRVESEERLIELQAASRSEIDRLERVLAVSERNASSLAGQLDGVRRQLAEAEHAAAAERAALRRTEGDVTGRLIELERRALEVNRGLDAERQARERTERVLASMSRGHRLMQGVVGELRELVARLSTAYVAEAAARTRAPRAESAPEVVPAAASATPDVAPAVPLPQPLVVAPQEREPPGGEGPEKLPARQREAAVEPGPEGEQGGEEMAEALAQAVARLRARASEQPPAAPVRRPPHRHAKSLIGRWRAARARRRQSA